MYKKLLIGALSVLLTTGVYSQKNFFADAESAYSMDRFFSASELYKKAEVGKRTKVDKKGYINFQIAECYRKMIQDDQAEIFYKRAIKLKYGNQNPEVHYRLGNTMLVRGMYKAALKEFESYKTKAGGTLADVGIESCNQSQEWLANPTRYKIESEVQLNTGAFDWAMAFADRRNKEVIFSSTRPGGLGEGMDENTGDYFNDLWITTRDQNGKWSQPLPLPPSINTEANEGAAVLNAKRDELYFTRCPVVKKENVGCDIWVSERQGTKWKAPKKIELKPEGGDSISIGQPALSKDGRTLIYSADLPGGKGGKDLWYSEWDNKEKKWGTPVNMADVNTKEADKFPYVAGDGSLYFSTDGRVGMGGLDIYKADADGKNKWKNIQNMGYPLNTNADDFGILFDGNNQERGFLTSSRGGGKGKDDLYSFRLPKIMFVLEVIVKNKNTMEPIPGATITLKTDEGLEFALTTDATGKVIYDANGAERYIIQEHGYEIDAFAENHFRAHGGFTTIGRKEGRRFYEEILVEELDEKTEYDMPQVLYPFDKWSLINTEQVNSNDSLNHLYNILIEHPNLVVELQAHTDCRGKAPYNQNLSQKRAETCVNYLIGKGIPRDRLVPVGYGEAKPREGLGCSAIEKLATEQDKEAAHQRNRRTQFKILSFDYETK
ncbi:MAG: peptidoglycan-associated lipoprotein [Parvicellaceae bacterium]|jgi:peptidoglycan-associated lipoprotein